MKDFPVFFGRYLRDRLPKIFFGIGAVGLFAAAFALYRLPVKAVLYPAAICFAAALLLGIFDFWRAWRKHRRLSSLSDLPENLGEFLSAYRNVDDCDYRALLDAALSLCRDVREREELRYSDMMDYYTTWVHQIKTPISAMRLILESRDSPEARRLSEELSRVEGYVGMVMCYLRLDSESNDFVFRVCEVDSLLHEILRDFSGQFIGRGLRLEYCPTGLRVITDEKWLAFVLGQILSNALKYTPSGSISIRAEGKTLCIGDTGIGICPEDLPRIFEKGYTGFNGRTDKKASGLGLYLCHRICRRLGHPISVTSTPGVGTTVKLDLSQNARRYE